MNYLKTNKQYYQLILNTATNMFTHGVAKLHTSEFLQLVSEHLVNDGVYLSWLDVSGVKNHAQLEQILFLHRQYFAYVDAHFLTSGYILLVSYNQQRELRPLTEELLANNEREYLREQKFSWPVIISQRYLQVKSKISPPLSCMDYPSIEINALKSYLQKMPESEFSLEDALSQFIF